jgi:hypothetical protein
LRRVGLSTFILVPNSDRRSAIAGVRYLLKRTKPSQLDGSSVTETGQGTVV